MCFTANKVRKTKPWMKKLENFFTKVFYRPCCIILPIKRNALWGLNSIDFSYLEEEDINWLKSLGFTVSKIEDDNDIFYKIEW